MLLFSITGVNYQGPIEYIFFLTRPLSLNSISSTHFGVLEIDLDSRSWKNEPSILADGGPRYRSVELGAIFEPFESVQIGAIFQFE